MSVALAGNPNVGKTTLFNALTGLSAKVSNYPGITVERRTGVLTLPIGPAELHDLPGTYSLNARSAEEQITFDALVGLAGQHAPDVVVVCLDATQLARSVYLLLQCRELGARCVGAMTMVDEAGAAAPDARALSEVVGCEVVPVTARTKRGLAELTAAIDRAARAERRAHWVWTPSPTLRVQLDVVRGALPASWRSTARYAKGPGEHAPSGRGVELAGADDAIALWALTCFDISEHDADELVGVPPDFRATVIAQHFALDDEPILARWAWLDREIPKLAHSHPDRSLTERIDRVLLHRAAGFAVFAAIMSLLFMSLFAWAAPLIDGIDHLFKAFGAGLRDVLGTGMFSDFLVDGVIAGVGAVLVFLPQILMLFLFLGFLEDCGYLARVAYLMDRVMRSMNLHG
ncbi:MAG TPA: FeoB small GTPase domain-containing protein, partial [Kofleriaceae bacterium]|nr:FeoB small GTPase domain-containing protein [Kofleriaceae bacterium]